MEANVGVGNTFTGRLASLIVGANYDSLPDDAPAKAKASIWDCLGVMVAGSRERAPKIIADLVQQLGGKEDSSIVGTGIKTSPPFAAWVNGTAAHALEFDDAGGEAWSAHPSAVVLPAVLALSESRRVSGKETILAYIIGLEVGARVGRAMQEGHYEYGYVLGWHNTSTIGSLATAAASAKVLRLDAKKTCMALGIAGSFASGLLKANIGTMTKPMHAGRGASNGVLAALLAEKGFTASQSILEGPFGFCRMFTSNRECYFEKLADGFGLPWDVVSPGIIFKPYPSCRGTHPSIDAALYLRGLNRFEPAQIAEVVCRTSAQVPEILRYHRPQTVLEAKFCLEYCVAIALLEGEVRLKHFTDEKWLTDRKVQELVAKVRYEHPGDWGVGMNLPQEVVIKTVDGKEFSKRLKLNETKGAPQNPMTQAELRAKYMDCASSVLSSASIERSMELLNNLETLDNLSELMGLLTASST